MSTVDNSPSHSVAGFDIRTRAAGQAVTPVHDHPLLNKLYLARGITQREQLDASLQSLLSYRQMLGIDQAVDLLLEARANQHKVLIVGDYDTDGATSTALAMLGFQSMGIQASFLLPNRFEYGYGLSEEIVALALKDQPDLIVTVDNGIASFAGVNKAKNAGVKVLVTDHHLAAETLPDADAIINPNQPSCSFPSKAACGCTVLYYLLIALRAQLRDQGEQNLPNLGQWLDLVALATVADVVPLDDNNRRLVNQGLQRIRAGKCRAGIKALFEVASKDWRQAKSMDFGFVVGPRLNAAGRLDDMTLGVRLLLTDDDAEAKYLASQLNDLNQERRQIESSMLADINADLDLPTSTSELYGAVVYQPDWHEGVIGILASRVKDKLHRPVVAFADSGDNLLKGSCRSVVGVHLRDSLDWITKQDDTIIDKFGGHAMAAGLTIHKNRLDEFTTLFNQAVRAFADTDALTPHIWTDGELPREWLTLENAKMLEQAGPWGQAFAEPTFFGQWSVLNSRVLAEKHLKLTLSHQNTELEAIAFNCKAELLINPPKRISGVYQLSCNRFRGRETLQLIFNKVESAG